MAVMAWNEDNKMNYATAVIIIVFVVAAPVIIIVVIDWAAH